MNRERKIYDALDRRLAALLEELNPASNGEVSADDPIWKTFVSRWREYLQGIGASFVDSGEADDRWEEHGRFKVLNPLHLEEDGFQIIDMSLETAEKIIHLGLP